MWKRPGKTAECLKCVENHLERLSSHCTEKQAKRKCEVGPGPRPPAPPEPPAPPLPPLPPDPHAPRPHIVLWVVDDQGWANVGFHNPGNVHSPVTDGLANSGIVLDRHYTYRWCAPTRSALMTGRLPYHVLQTTNHVDRGFTMLPAKLRQVGYRTAQFGKWHLGNLAPWMTPVGRGFDTSLGCAPLSIRTRRSDPHRISVAQIYMSPPLPPPCHRRPLRRRGSLHAVPEDGGGLWVPGGRLVSVGTPRAWPQRKLCILHLRRRSSGDD